MGLFWNDPEEKKDVKEEKKVVPTQTSKPTVIPSVLPNTFTTTSPSDTTVNVSSSGKKDEFVATLRKVMNDHNIPGPDYLEFASAIESMKTLPLDEKTKFITCFAVLRAQGVTPERLIETGEVYVKLFDQVKSEFQVEVEKTSENVIKSKQSSINNLAVANKEIETQMVELTKKRLENEEKMKQLTSEVDKASSQITAQTSDFNAAYNEVVNEIRANENLIKQYLNQ